MSSIKLTADSGGGTFELKAPASSGNTRVLTLPDTSNGTVLMTTSPDADRYKVGEVIQTVFYSFLNNHSGMGLSGNISSTSFVDVGNLAVTITPKFADSKLIFETDFNARLDDDDGHSKYDVYDSTNDRYFSNDNGASHHYYAPTNAYPSVHIRILGTASYTTAMTLKLRVKISNGGNLNHDFSSDSRFLSVTEIKQ